MHTDNYYDQDPSQQPLWQPQELSTEDAQNVERQLFARDLGAIIDGFGRLKGWLGGDGDNKVNKVTAYFMPGPYVSDDPLKALIEGPSAAASEIYRRVDRPTGVVRIVENDSPDEFSFESLPGEAFSPYAIAAKNPITYMRLEATDNGIKASVGSLDQANHQHYSVPMTQVPLG